MYCFLLGQGLRRNERDSNKGDVEIIWFTNLNFVFAKICALNYVNKS